MSSIVDIDEEYLGKLLRSKGYHSITNVTEEQMAKIFVGSMEKTVPLSLNYTEEAKICCTPQTEPNEKDLKISKQNEQHKMYTRCSSGNEILFYGGASKIHEDIQIIHQEINRVDKSVNFDESGMFERFKTSLVNLLF
jgi:hypothetical protein